MQSDTGKVLFCYSDSTIKISRIGVFYNPYCSKRINMPVVCAVFGFRRLCLSFKEQYMLPGALRS